MTLITLSSPAAYRGAVGGGGVNPPEIPKVLQNRAKLAPIVKTVKNAEFRTPTPQDVRKKSSKILKLQGGSNMTRTVVDLFTHKSVPVIFEPPCT